MGELVNARVDLVTNQNRSTVAAGTVGGRPALLKRSGGSVVTGSIEAIPLRAKIVGKDQIPKGAGYVTTTDLSGSGGSTGVSLIGTFQLDSSYLFQHGSIVGKYGGRAVRVRASPNLDFGNIGYAANVAGSFGDVEFSLVANVPIEKSGSVSGIVASHPFHLDLEPTGGAGTHITGTYTGPASLFALIVGTIAYFAG